MTRTGLVIAILMTATAAHAQSGDPAAGADVYIADCASCHAAAARIVRKIDGVTPEDKTAWLASFLPTHHLQNAEGQADLIAYLLSL